MRKLHTKLTQKYPAYHNWHQTQHHNTIHWGVLIVFTLLIFVTMSRWAPISLAADTTLFTTPTNLIATAISSSQINLSWTASTDDSVSIATFSVAQTWQQTLEQNFDIADTFDIIRTGKA